MIRCLMLLVSLIILLVQGCGGGFDNEDSPGASDFGTTIFSTDTLQ
jgi:hypothetical protein